MSKDPIQVLNDHGLDTAYCSATNGGEYKSPCPFCRSNLGDGGTDRLCVWPVKGRFWCRRCQRSGGLAELLIELSPMKRERAERLIGVPKGRVYHVDRPQRRVDREAWAARVGKLVERCSSLLFRQNCEEYLDYLRDRGLTDETIRAARLGALDDYRCYMPEDFGISRYGEEDPSPGTVRCPAGIVIPHFDEHGRCRKVLFRCEYESDGKYRVLLGSEAVSLTLEPGGRVDAVVVIESALDAVLCRQEVPEGFTFVGLGSAAYRIDERAEALAREAKVLLIATDRDDAGAEAFRRMRNFYPNSHRLIVPQGLGKDVGEAYLAGMSIADWCEAGLELARERNGHAPARRNRSKKKSGHAPAAVAVGSTLEGESNVMHVNYEYVAGTAHAESVVNKLVEGESIAVDIETAPLPEYADDPRAALDPWRSRPRLLQATTGGKVYVFDLNKVPLEQLAPLFQGVWVAHNAVFDYKHLLQAELSQEPVPPNCTMLCDNALTNRLRSLADLASARLGIHVDKDMQGSDWSTPELSREQLTYAARDAKVTHQLWEDLRREVHRRGRKPICDLMHEAQQSVALMELNGVGLDLERHAAAVKQWKRERKRALGALRELAGDDLNLRSPAQLAALLEEHATEGQLRDWPRTKTGQLSTAADEVLGFADNPAVERLLAYRRRDDMLSRYGEGLAAQVSPATGRLHPHFRIAGAKTGRMSASEPNVQGMPRDAAFRRLFVPEPGSVLVRADYNQMQLRIAALLSGDARLLDAYERGKDVHRLTAASVLGKRPSEVTPEERNLAKAIGFGLLFGMGSAGLVRYARKNYGANLSEGEAERVRERFFDTYPDVRAWQLEQVDRAECTECSETPCGRIRDFAGEGKEYYENAAMNTPIQGGESEVMLAALALLPEALDPLDGLIVNCVHDEIVVECPMANVGEVESALRDCMERGMRRVFPTATLNKLVEVGNGPTWGDAK